MLRRALLVLAIAAPAAAEPGEDHKKAAQLFQEGRKLLSQHDAEGACAKFDEAIHLEPLAAGVMLNLGLCSETLGKYKTALAWFRKAMQRATEMNPPLPDVEREAREHAADLAARVATIKIAFTRGNADETVVTIDGEPIARADYPRVEIDPGQHVLIARAPGKSTLKQELDVTGKGGDVVALELVDRPPDPGAPQKRYALYTGAGAGGLLALSLGLTLYEKHEYNDAKGAALMGDKAALAETQHATSVAHYWCTGLAITGVLAAGAAAYLYYTAPERPPETIAIVPTAGGIVAVGWF